MTPRKRTEERFLLLKLTSTPEDRLRRCLPPDFPHLPTTRLANSTTSVAVDFRITCTTHDEKRTMKCRRAAQVRLYVKRMTRGRQYSSPPVASSISYNKCQYPHQHDRPRGLTKIAGLERCHSFCPWAAHAVTAVIEIRRRLLRYPSLRIKQIRSIKPSLTRGTLTRGTSRLARNFHFIYPHAAATSECTLRIANKAQQDIKSRKIVAERESGR